jgi:endonuclease-3
MKPDREKIRRIIRALEKAYGVPVPVTRRPDPLDALVQTILSQNTNDRNRDRAYRNLRQRYPTNRDLSRARPGELARVVAAAGLQKQKAPAILRVVRWAHRRFGTHSLRGLRGLETEEIEKELLPIKGIGPKTVYVVLAMNLGRDVFPIDTHCLRLLVRLGILPPKTDLAKAHRLMNGSLPAGKAYALHLNLIRHGRTVCHARKPTCRACVLRRLCAFVRTRRADGKT